MGDESGHVISQLYSGYSDMLLKGLDFCQTDVPVSFIRLWRYAALIDLFDLVIRQCLRYTDIAKSEFLAPLILAEWQCVNLSLLPENANIAAGG
jgi:hypothetical protein